MFLLNADRGRYQRERLQQVCVIRPECLSTTSITAVVCVGKNPRRLGLVDIDRVQWVVEENSRLRRPKCAQDVRWLRLIA